VGASGLPDGHAVARERDRDHPRNRTRAAPKTIDLIPKHVTVQAVRDDRKRSSWMPPW
jgi:hypothetical protein